MTQLGELRDAWPRFEAGGIKLYAISYDEPDALAAFSEAMDIPFPLLSDADSRVIREYGILNTEIRPDEVPFYGIPFPGTYVLDESGVVVDKFFPRHLANRESADAVLDSALGELRIGESEPQATAADEDIRITAAFHGGPLKSGIKRSVVVRFELPEGMHVYGEPVPDGMVATQVTVRGPDGLVVLDTIAPPTAPLRLDALDADLQVWSGTVDLVVPVFANSHLIDIHAPADALPREVRIEVELRYQACTDAACLIPRTERFELTVPVERLDVPAIAQINLDGQRVTSMDSVAHFVKLAARFAKAPPAG